MKLRALETAGLALALSLTLTACNVSDDSMVESRIAPDDSVAERVRAAANAESASGSGASPAMAAVAPPSGSAPPPAPAAASPGAAPGAAPIPTTPPIQVASAEPAAVATGYDPAAGKPLYATYCASCHGASGRGDGPAAAAMNPKPANHGDGGYMNVLSNDHLYKVVDKGGMAVGKSPMMTPWGGVLSNDQIWQVVAYMRSLADPRYTGPMP